MLSRIADCSSFQQQQRHILWYSIPSTTGRSVAVALTALCTRKNCKKDGTYCECLTSWPVFLRSETQRGRVGGAIKIFCACVLRVRRVLLYRAARWTYRGGPMTAKRDARESSAQEVRHGQYFPCTLYISTSPFYFFNYSLNKIKSNSDEENPNFLFPKKWHSSAYCIMPGWNIRHCARHRQIQLNGQNECWTQWLHPM